MNQTDAYAHLEAARLAGATIVASPDMHNWHIVGDQNKKPEYTCQPDKYAVLCDPSMFLAAQPPKAEVFAYVVPCAHVAPDGSWEDGPASLVFAHEADDYAKRVGAPLYTATPTAAADSEDAARYRWLRNEAWGCDKINRKLPRVGVFDAIARFTDLAEEALDATLDAARNQEADA